MFIIINLRRSKSTRMLNGRERPIMIESNNNDMQGLYEQQPIEQDEQKRYINITKVKSINGYSSMLQR